MASVSRSKPLSEYPRPRLVRKNWLCLNGFWDYAIQPASYASDSGPELEPKPKTWDGQILVPFAIETRLSTVSKALLPGQVLWYKKSVRIPLSWAGSRIMLHFEAVDYACALYVNSLLVGTHKGGYLPFSFELPGPEIEENHGRPKAYEIMLAVKDPSDSGLQQRGKQSLKPGGIYYTATSGIWQTVWMEALSKENSISGFSSSANSDLSGARLVAFSEKPGRLLIKIAMPDNSICKLQGNSGEYLDFAPGLPRLWSDQDPWLYHCKLYLFNVDGKLVDEAASYFAIRSIELGHPHDGQATDYKSEGRAKRPIFLLNKKAIFLNAPLDQAYWPESGLTAPSDEAIVFDIESMKKLGFNGLRKHVKIESRRFYWHADRLGMLVAQDAVSGGQNRAKGSFKIALAMIFGIHLEDCSQKAMALAGRYNKENQKEFESELLSMLALLKEHPSIMLWSVFNESWGQYESKRIAELVKKADPGRPVDAVSGWHDNGAGELRSRHTYIVRLKNASKRDKRPYFISEYGGYNLAVKDHLWDPERRFGYRFFNTKRELEIAYSRLIRRQLIPLIKNGLTGAVYTQLSDVETETNGFYTYDRKVLKMDRELIIRLNNEIMDAFGKTQS